ncbi:tumor necrosis factor receptor superfamily member 9a [Mastacembelus armatus]|uniref:tumor necrosis factor receptor superfamily member 9a n=1 Tax=Mastacembelus armatus TaxID=205130 RepID=UPI000E45EF41|nr:tumor necrosis factor receptor superfamily member 9-like [Mastacembelus armatus]
MAVILWAMGLSLLMQGYLFSLGRTETGCMKWVPSGDDVCCEACHPGNRLVKKCGPNPKELCKPCERKTFTVIPAAISCTPCRQCIGALVTVKNCTATSNTICSCKEGLICGDDSCSFCTEKCDKGQEPTEDRSCRPCPDGMFSDQIQQKCKPWSTKCPNEGEYIVDKGNRFTDIKCNTVPIAPSHRPIQPDTTQQAWPLVLSVVTSVALIGFSIIIIVTAAVKTLQKRKKTKKPITKPPIIRTPTDDPQTLIAIECSFHEAQQEQGSSQESLNSGESSEHLIAVKGNLAR